MTKRGQDESGRLELISAAVENAQEMILALNGEWRVVYANPSAAEALELPSLDGSAGPGFNESFKLAQGQGEVLRDCLAESGACECEGRASRSDGSEFPVRLSIARTNSAPDTGGFVVVARDITEHRNHERRLLQAARMRVARQLAGGVAHDFNNLLMSILGYAGLLKGDVDQGGLAHEAAVTIERSAQKAADLTRVLLDFSRQHERLDAQLDLHDSIKEAVALLRHSLPDNVDIDLQLEAGDATVRGDPTQMQQVFKSLGRNACDAMAQGGTLTIRTEARHFDTPYSRRTGDRLPGAYTVAEVRDTGRGIAEQDLQRVFDPFFTTKDKGEGVGLGLAMVEATVSDHGGFVHVESELGKGTTFRVFLPFVEHA